MKTKVQKWGNSLGVRLPKAIADQKSLTAGVSVIVSIQNDRIVVEPVWEGKISLEADYKAMAKDDARELEAREWLEGGFEGLDHENVWPN